MSPCFTSNLLTARWGRSKLTGAPRWAPLVRVGTFLFFIFLSSCLKSSLRLPPLLPPPPPPPLVVLLLPPPPRWNITASQPVWGWQVCRVKESRFCRRQLLAGVGRVVDVSSRTHLNPTPALSSPQTRCSVLLETESERFNLYHHVCYTWCNMFLFFLFK